MDWKCHIVIIISFLSAFHHVQSMPPKVDENDLSQHWELVTELKVGDVLPVLKYKSKRTGLTILLAQAESPIVNGYFCVTTEAKTSDGLPHTLEHLIFLGSEDYPYKEMLDLTANRCLADRTNAWTDTDHTCYTVYTAGSGGFLNILPIYMDHILHPTLRDEDFLTEVHHISEEGEDAGVVYSEMQGVENSASNIIYFSAVSEIYPGNSSFEIQTGGVLKNLRESTTIERVREYHKRYYQPKNIYITVTGSLDPQELFQALEPVEQKILEKDPYPEYERPFETSYPPLTEDINKEIKFPSNDEKLGRVVISRRLPFKLWENVTHMYGLRLLGSYLTSTSVSPLMSAFVDIPDPYATDVDFDLLFFSDPVVSIDFENVPVEKMKDVEGHFVKVIKKLIDDGPEKFDMDRMNTIIERRTLGRKMSLENSPHLIVPKPAVMDMVYGHKAGDLSIFLKDGPHSHERQYASKKAEYWLQVLNETFSGPRLRILAYPSQEYNEELQNKELERLKKQKERLGPDGLKAAGEAVRNAIKSQQLPPPEVLESVPIADVNKISFRELTYYNYTTEKQPKGFDLKSIPFKFHLDDIHTQFIRYYMFLDMSSIKQEDRPYLVLMTETWLQSPLLVDGKMKTFEEVIKTRSKEVLTIYNDLGYKGSVFNPGSQSELIMFYVETLMDKYEEGLNILREALFNVKFTEERISSLLSQLLNSLPSVKLSASSITETIYDNMYFNNETTLHHTSFLRQYKFLKKIKEQMEKDPEPVIKKLKELTQQLVHPKNAFVYMATNVDKLTSLYGSKAAGLWKDFFPKHLDFPSKESLSERINTPSEHKFADPNPDITHAITGVPGSDSCQLKQSVPYDHVDWEDDDVAAVRVMLQYLSDQMYNRIRGQGLTYGVHMSSSVTEGRMNVKFSRSSQLEAAYDIFREIMSEYGQTENDHMYEHTILESARGSQTYDWAEREETVDNLSSASVKSILRGVSDPFYNRRFTRKVASVNMEDVKKVARIYLHKFLDPKISQLTVVCGPNEVENMQKAFKKWGFDLFHIEDVDDSFLSN